MADLGFLGLGTMGGGMARRLVDAGHRVHVWNRTAASADDLVSAGALRADSPANALAAGISFSMFGTDEAAESVLSVETLRAAAGGVHVSMASLSPTTIDTLAARCARAEVAFLAAPVLGRPPVAAAGKLNIIAAGPQSTLDRVSEYLDILGMRTWYLGPDPRTANVVKIAVNYNIIHAIQSLAESIAIVEHHGVDATEFVDLLSHTLFGGVVYTGYGDLIARRGYSPPGLSVALGLKDLGLAEAAAAEKGLKLPVSPVLRDLFERALADPDLGPLDWAAVAELTRGR